MDFEPMAGTKSCRCACGQGTYERTFTWLPDDIPESGGDGWYPSQIRAPPYELTLKIHCEKCSAEFKLHERLDGTIHEFALAEIARVDELVRKNRELMEANRAKRNSIREANKHQRIALLEPVLGPFLDATEQAAQAEHPRRALGTALFRHLNKNGLPTSFTTEAKYRNAFAPSGSLRRFVLGTLAWPEARAARDIWTSKAAVPPEVIRKVREVDDYEVTQLQMLDDEHAQLTRYRREQPRSRILTLK